MDYNLLNLPSQIKHYYEAEGSTTDYAYLTDGRKLTANFNGGEGLEYLGSFVYLRDKQGGLSFESTDFVMGRIENSPAGYKDFVKIGNQEKMKKIMILFLVLFFCGCNAQKNLQRNTAKVIDKYLEKADTIYLYSVAFENADFIWFHQGGYIYSFTIKPYEVKTNKAIKAKNIKIKDDCIDKYFDISINKDVQCFDHTLDGEWIKMFVKGEKSRMTSVNIACLLKTPFKPNTFPYKLQYDFSKIIESKYLNFTVLDKN